MSKRTSNSAITADVVPPMRRRRPNDGSGCDLCSVPHALTFHHLIPRRNHHKTWFREMFGIAEMRARGAWLCRGCHDFIHDHFDESTLGRRLNSLDTLKAEPEVAKHIAWAGRQRVGR